MSPALPSPLPHAVLVAAAAFLAAACGGSSGGSGTTTMPPAPPSAPPGLVSTASPFSQTCGFGPGVVNVNSEVEPFLAVNPRDARNLVAVWQQDRWNNGSARGVRTGVSLDGGATWVYREPPFSVCAGGTQQRATDPWVTFGPDGTVHQMALATSGAAYEAGSSNGMYHARSTDGGLTWSAPVALIEDGPTHFNDKNSMTADPLDARYVYAAWDRLVATGGGPAYFARSVDGGRSWEAARPVFDPGVSSQVIGSLVVVLPDGSLVYVFNRIDLGNSQLQAMRSTDKGATWGAPVKIADMLTRGTRDPETGASVRDGSIIPGAAAGPDGRVHVVWQDSRASGGSRDAIALSSSSDGGRTWSAPVRVNSNVAVPAFTPQVHVRADGMIGVTFFDFRSNTADPSTLLTDYWLARSGDGTNWTEARVAGPFNLNSAPNAGGYFLGDYMGLASTGTTFLPLYVRTTDDLTNRNDVFLTPMAAAATPAADAADPKRALAVESRRETYRAEPLPRFVPDAALRAELAAQGARALAARRPAPARSREDAPPR